jgi:L-glutamine-phosphate cytidylyltransferase
MKIIILAAGRGSRINRLTRDNPKTLIKLKQKPLLYYQLKAINLAGIKKKDIAVVTGYKKSKFKEFNLKEFINNKWKTTNMVYSLSKASRWLKLFNCIVLYGDILYSSEAIELLKNSKNKFCVLNNRNWYSYWKKRFSNPLVDLESYKVNKNDFLTEIGKREISLKSIKGQFMGMFKINPLNWLIMKKKIDKNNYNISTTELLNKLIQEDNVKIKSINYQKYWYEIDSYSDFKIAKNFFK